MLELRSEFAHFLWGIAVADSPIAMHPLAVGSAAATPIRIQPGVVTLAFGLAGLAVDLKVIHLHVPITAVVGVGNSDAATQTGRGRVVLHAGRQRPGRNIVVVDPQCDGFSAGSASRADNEALVATSAPATTSTAAFAHSDVRGAAALKPFRRHDHVIVGAEVQSIRSPRVEVVAGGDGSSDSLLLPNAPVLIESRSPNDGWLV